MQSLVILGRQPALGLAELESLLGSSNVIPAGNQAALLDVAVEDIPFTRLGGALKLCKVLSILPSTQWRVLEKHLMKIVPSHIEELPIGKLQLGLSVQGFDVTTAQLEATGLNIKKVIRRHGRSVRLVPNHNLELNSAQIHFNKLTGPTGLELVITRDIDRTVIAQTIFYQDIQSYTFRDRERPKRDARVGMLPPKLAQTIINLATGSLVNNMTPPQCILDPFCGTGVLLQEAELMGYQAYGTDLEQRMIDYSEANLQWLTEHYKLLAPQPKLHLGDATRYTWEMPVTYIAGETYLGKPFTRPPEPEALAQTVADCNLIIKKFLRNIFDQVPSGTRFCLAVPAWSTPNSHEKFKLLPLIDQIGDLGYNRVSFEHAENDELIYFRPDQFVARQLLVISKK